MEDWSTEKEINMVKLKKASGTGLNKYYDKLCNIMINGVLMLITFKMVHHIARQFNYM